jgi:eukaryotic-like serine/threonine-protein kinase
MKGGVDETTLGRLDEVVMRSLERDASKRFATARDFAIALERVIAPASMLEMSEWMESAAGDIIRDRSKRIAEVEELTTGSKAMSIASLTAEISRAKPDAAEDGALSNEPLATVNTGSSLEPFGRTDTSHVTPKSTQPRKPTRRPLYAVGGLVMFLLTAATFAFAFKSQQAPLHVVATVPSMSAPAESSALSRAVPEPSIVSPEATLAATSNPPIEPATTATVKKTGRLPAQTPSHSHTHVAAPVTASTPTLPKPDCTPPFTIDANGRKHFKPNCF